MATRRILPPHKIPNRQLQTYSVRRLIRCTTVSPWLQAGTLSNSLRTSKLHITARQLPTKVAKTPTNAPTVTTRNPKLTNGRPTTAPGKPITKSTTRPITLTKLRSTPHYSNTSQPYAKNQPPKQNQLQQPDTLPTIPTLNKLPKTYQKTKHCLNCARSYLVKFVTKLKKFAKAATSFLSRRHLLLCLFSSSFNTTAYLLRP